MQLRRPLPRPLGALAPQHILFILGAAIISALHFLMMSLFGWPEGERRFPAGVSISHGFQWGVSGFLLLLVGAILVTPYGGKTLGQTMKTGACFLYGAFVAHALLDSRFGGDWLDPLLYSGSAALVVWFAAFVFDRIGG